MEEKIKYKKNGDDNNAFSLKQEVFSICEMIVCSLVIVTLIFTFIFRMVYVEGESMEYTLQDGDRLAISHLFYEPEQGDIVVLELDEKFSTPIIKRVIATEGQTIDITDYGKVVVDGQVLQEDYLHDVTAPKSLNYPMTIPKGCVFVMGDNRDNSNDSRNFGYVDEKNILGQVICRVYPFQNMGFF